MYNKKDVLRKLKGFDLSMLLELDKIALLDYAIQCVKVGESQYFNEALDKADSYSLRGEFLASFLDSMLNGSSFYVALDDALYEWDII